MENKLIRTNEGTKELVAVGGGGGKIITGMDVNDSGRKPKVQINLVIIRII